MIESTEMPSIIIYTDHSAAVSISRQTTLTTFSTNKLNLRLVRASQYLSGFNLFICHKIDKSNVILDALSKLQADVTFIEKIDVLKSLYDFSIELCEGDLTIRSVDSLSKQFVCYHIILIEMADELKERLKTIYNENSHWNKILAIIKEAFKINDEKNI